MQSLGHGIRRDHMDTHQPREQHADENRQQRQGVVLQPDSLVIHAKNVLPNELVWRSVWMGFLEGHFRHYLSWAIAVDPAGSLCCSHLSKSACGSTCK